MGYRNRDHKQRKNISEKKFQRILNNNLHNTGIASIRRARYYDDEVFSFEACVVGSFVYARLPCKDTVANRLSSYYVRFDLNNPVDFIRFKRYSVPVEVIYEEDFEEELF